uniref:Transmembrane protein n=1 Tax=Lotus japonicus TaxID=34305 RepID=I3S5G4_LOTJA|nr:unknown [Lotus japonicus]
MASLLRRIPIAAVILLLSLSATATARPCRSFIISSYSFRNPSSNTFATITEIRSLTPLYINDKPYDIFFDHPQNHHQQIEPQHGASLPRGPLGFSTAPYYDFTSLRDRTKDILSVALALLFGLGCGALTAATMYLVWSVFSARYDYRAAMYGDLSDDEEVDSPKKTGYVKIPAAEAPAKGSV